MMMSTEMLVKTGKEKKSMRNPRRRKPAMRITIPVKKVSRMAYLGLGHNQHHDDVLVDHDDDVVDHNDVVVGHDDDVVGHDDLVVGHDE